VYRFLSSLQQAAMDEHCSSEQMARAVITYAARRRIIAWLLLPWAS